jgi:hypothetical protein
VGIGRKAFKFWLTTSIVWIIAIVTMIYAGAVFPTGYQANFPLPPLPRRIERVRVSIASPLVQLSPNGRRVGIRIVTFEACSGFTHVTAHRIAQSPKATFVTRLQPCRLPSQAARQLPDQSTILRVQSSSTDDSRLRGALPTADLRAAKKLRSWPEVVDGANLL